MPSKVSTNIAGLSYQLMELTQEYRENLLARAAAGIAKSFAGLGNEFPVVAFGMQGKFQNSEGISVAHFAGSQRHRKRAMVFAAGADNELPDAARPIRITVRVLRREAFVVVIMSVKYQSGVGVVEILPKRLHLRIISVFRAGTEKGLVPVSQCAYMRVRLQVSAQPFFFH